MEAIAYAEARCSALQRARYRMGEVSSRGFGHARDHGRKAGFFAKGELHLGLREIDDIVRR